VSIEQNLLKTNAWMLAKEESSPDNVRYVSIYLFHFSFKILFF
jgi:hypothetical protein